VNAGRLDNLLSTYCALQVCWYRIAFSTHSFSLRIFVLHVCSASFATVPILVTLPQALIDFNEPGVDVSVVALFDHEEVPSSFQPSHTSVHLTRRMTRRPEQVGSNSHQGAGSLQLGDNLARITRSLFPDAPADAHQVQLHDHSTRTNCSSVLQYRFSHAPPGPGHALFRSQHGHGARRAPKLL
jgi:aspartyl aminopeptidase